MGSDGDGDHEFSRLRGDDATTSTPPTRRDCNHPPARTRPHFGRTGRKTRSYRLRNVHYAALSSFALQSASLLRRVSAASSSSACQPRPLGFTATVESRPSQRRSHPRSTPHCSVSDPTPLLAFTVLLFPPSNGDNGFICCAARHAPGPNIQPSFGRCQPHAFNAASRVYPPPVIPASLAGVLYHRAKPRKQCRASTAKR